MKGKSLSNSQLRFMINKVCNMLYKENIKILSEVYDGQWQSTVMSSESGKPLNLLHLQNLKMSTGQILEDIMSCCKVPNGDKDLPWSLSISFRKNNLQQHRNYQTSYWSSAMYITGWEHF